MYTVAYGHSPPTPPVIFSFCIFISQNAIYSLVLVYIMLVFIDGRCSYCWFLEQDGESPASSSEDLASFLEDLKNRFGYNEGLERDDLGDGDCRANQNDGGEKEEEEGGGAADSPDSVQADGEDSCDAAGVSSV